MFAELSLCFSSLLCSVWGDNSLLSHHIVKELESLDYYTEMEKKFNDSKIRINQFIDLFLQHHDSWVIVVYKIWTEYPFSTEIELLFQDQLLPSQVQRLFTSGINKNRLDGSLVNYEIWWDIFRTVFFMLQYRFYNFNQTVSLTQWCRCTVVSWGWYRCNFLIMSKNYC